MTRLSINVVPNAKADRLIEESGCLKVYLKAPAVDGKANKALIGFLAEHFDIKKSHISIVKGLKSREKIVEIGQ